MRFLAGSARRDDITGDLYSGVAFPLSAAQ
jgi:hypothetical protein